MFGSSGKFGRGGGGAGRGGGPPKRGGLHNPFPPPQPSAQRLSGPPRAPIGAASRRMQSGSGAGAAPLPAAEETFRLVSKSPLSFGMIIRLTPDLVEEIRRVEAQGGTARIKFDSNANNVSGNVIEVGGKDFSFQWSSELGDCDIYEETVSGEDGNGLLVESGSAWRKLNVQRVLDENIKNHVKMRSEEAERKLKARKAIVLDPANPSVKNQAKTMAAASVESNMRRMPFKPKKEPAFKKRKVEPNPVAIAGPSKPVFKSGTSSISTAKNRLSVSPLPSTPEQPVASSSPFAVGNSTSASKPKVINRDDATNSDREMPNRTFPSAAGEASRNKHSGSASLDLRNTLITLLVGKPQGMDFKEIEKAVGDKHPDFRMDIEAVLKKIAHYQYPGKYILNAGVEIESVKKPSLETGSSPECTDEQIPVAEALSLAKTGAGEFDQRTQLNLNMGEEPNPIENIDIQSTSPDPFTTDKRMNNNSEGGGSSSESGSDSESSDSDSSDSGSESGSQSKSRSRSPAGSGSASSSDSESDGSSSSKEGFDDDVDIMVSDDDDRLAAEKKLQASEILLLSSRKTFRDGHPHDGMDETGEGDQIRSSALDLNGVGKYDDMSDEADIDDLPNDNNVKSYQNHETEEGESTDWLSQAENRRSQEEEMPLSPGEYKPFDNERVSNFGFNEVSGDAIKQRGGVMQTSAKDNLDYEHHDSSEKVSRPKSKRASDPNRFQRKSESAKSLKEKETMADKNQRGENAYSSSEPARFLAYENANRSHSNADFVNSLFTDVQQPAQRGDHHKTRDKLPAIADRPSKRVENLSRNSKNFERFSAFPDESDNSVSRGNHLQDKLPVPRDKLHNEREDENNSAFEKSALRNESGSGTGDRFSTLPDSHYRKCGKISGKGKDGVHAARMHTASLNKENGKPDIERGNTLRREPSDLELGEFREPVPEETQGSKRQFERKSSFKVENKSNTTENLHSDSNKGKPVGKTAQELKIQSPIYSDNQDKFHPRNVLEDDFEDSVRSQQRTVPAGTKQFPRPDHVDPEAGSQWDRLSDVAGKAKKNVGKTNQGTGLEGHAGTTRNSKNGCPVVGSNSKETKKHKSNPLTDLVERKDTSFENNTNGRNKRESSSDEDDSFYLKYDKDEPELKGVIQDHAQYKEYVKEYREKYDLYCSLDGTLKNYGNDFEKLGHELNLAKGRDSERYYRILEQISENYRLCIPRVKRMKKVFIVLHEELKQLKERIRDYAVACGKD